MTFSGPVRREPRRQGQPAGPPPPSISRLRSKITCGCSNRDTQLFPCFSEPLSDGNLWSNWVAGDIIAPALATVTRHPYSALALDGHYQTGHTWCQYSKLFFGAERSREVRRIAKRLLQNPITQRRCDATLYRPINLIAQVQNPLEGAKVVPSLKRLSTEYVALEDRIRITGELEKVAPVVIWMTHRLFSQAIPLTLRWLQAETASSTKATSSPKAIEVVQSFAQEAARAELKPQNPVRADPSGATWIAHTVEIASAKDRLGLTFRGSNNQAASVSFKPIELRQWLSIVHLAWTKAQWSPQIWPDWVKGEVPQQQPMVLH